MKKVIDFLQKEMGVRKIRFPESSSIGVKPVSIEGSERLIRAAIEYALKNHRRNVTLVHKGNIMKFTEGGFKNWGYDLVRREFADVAVAAPDCNGVAPEGKLLVKDCICDAFLQQILTRPDEYDVIATMNLNGDYVSDALAARVGGIGIRQNFAGGFDDGGVVRRTGFLPERFVFLFRQPMPGFPAFLGGKYAFGTAPHGAQHGRHVRERHFGAGGERKLLIDVARIVKERAVGVGQVAPGAARFLQVIFK